MTRGPSSTTADEAIAEAWALQRAGRLADAESRCRAILAHDPKHGGALHLRGIIAYQTGRNHAAGELVRKAIALDGQSAAYHNTLGVVLTAQGRLVQAVASLRRALALMPSAAEIHNNLGVAIYRQGQYEHAIECYERAQALDPDYAPAWQNLGNALLEQGDRDRAEAAFRRAIALRPGYAEAHNSLGIALIDRVPSEAEAAFRAATAADPDFAKAHNNLGNALVALGRFEEAEASLREAIGLAPDDAQAHRNLAEALRHLGRLEEAQAQCRRALALAPKAAQMHQSLGNVLLDQCRIDEALVSLRRAVALAPAHAALHSSLIFALHYPDGPATAIEDEARRWNERHGIPLARIQFARDHDPERRLRIGYVSPDFRRHSVAHFLEPLLRAHDRASVEVLGYADVGRPDAVTERLRGLCDRWRVTIGLSDAALAEAIAADGVDILVDLAGHSAHNRLSAFVRKPAPVQVTWLGYPGTTGLEAMDYRLVDAMTDPPDRAGWSSETLVRLSGGFLCYGAPADAPPVGPLPAAAADAPGVTFGSFNNPAKLSDSTLDAWSAVLARLPGSRLLLKGRPFADPLTRALTGAHFAARGIAADRIMLEGHTAGDAEHLAQYERLDIALDPFPYNGTATTCEALWMGVPVVTLAGDRHGGRVGASLLAGLGLGEWIAADAAAYVEIAAARAADLAQLAELRAGLRERMAASPLCDATAFARKIEAAYRSMWRAWAAAT